MDKKLAIERVFGILGSQKALAQKLQVSEQAVSQYRNRIPAERVLDIEAAVGQNKAGLTPLGVAVTQLCEDSYRANKQASVLRT